MKSLSEMLAGLKLLISVIYNYQSNCISRGILNFIFIFVLFVALTQEKVIAQTTDTTHDTTHIEEIVLGNEQADLLKKQLYTDSMKLSGRYYLNGLFGLALNFSNFTKIPNTNNCCQKFTGGVGDIFQINFAYELPFDMNYGFGVRLGFSNNINKFKEVSQIPLMFGFQERNGEFNYLLNSNFNLINFEPYYYYNPYERVNTVFSFGLNYVFLATYSQWEQIGNSTNAVFKDTRTKIRNYFNGELEQKHSLIPFLSVGASYEFPMNKEDNLRIVPEINLRYNLSSFVVDSSWKQFSINVGVSVKYYDFTPYKEPPLPPVPPKDPPILANLKLPVAPPVLQIKADIKDIDSLGNVSESKGLKVEDFAYTSLKPLLNYVFFDENSSKIPERYVLLDVTKAENFKLENLLSLDIIQTYYNVLNIVGLRLKQYKDAKITLTGCNSNYGDEKNNKELSLKRAESIKQYFVDVWGIEESRILVEARNLPKEASRTDEELGRQENMRVEITSDNEEINEHIISDEIVRNTFEKTIRFNCDVKSEANIHSLLIEVEQDGKIIADHQKIFDSPLTSYSWDWLVKKELGLEKLSPIYYYVTVEDELGQTVKSEKIYIPIERITVDLKRLEKIKDVTYENYSLILFDYGKSDLGRENNKIVNFVKSRVSQNAKVEIVGYTDSMGDEDINEKISTNRAKYTYKKLNLKNATYRGKGEKDLLFDNNSPEGRFYCRTVVIYVENVIE